MATQLKNVSILTIGEAKGHNLYVDETSLQEALAVAQSMGRIKVTNGHGAKQVMDILGYVENFKIEGQRLLGDLTLLDSDKADYVASLASLMPDQFGLSLSFSGVPDELNGKRFARVTEIYDVSVVTEPAANPAGMFSAFSRLPVDTFSKPQMDTPVAETKKEELSAPASVSETKAETNKPALEAVSKSELSDESNQKTSVAEPTLADIAGMLSEILGYMKKDSVEDAPEAETEAGWAPSAIKKARSAIGSFPRSRSVSKSINYQAELQADSAQKQADEETVAEPAPEPVAAEAKAETKELSQPVPSVIAAKVIELEASRGVKPLEVSTETAFSRADLLSQFNAEKDPRRAAEIFKKLQLAR